MIAGLEDAETRQLDAEGCGTGPAAGTDAIAGPILRGAERHRIDIPVDEVASSVCSDARSGSKAENLGASESFPAHR